MLSALFEPKRVALQPGEMFVALEQVVQKLATVLQTQNFLMQLCLFFEESISDFPTVGHRHEFFGLIERAAGFFEHADRIEFEKLIADVLPVAIGGHAVRLEQSFSSVMQKRVFGGAAKIGKFSGG